MIKTAANIIKGVLKGGKRKKHNFRQIRWVREKILKHQEDKTIKRLDFGNFSIYYKRPYELLHSYREIFEKEIYRFPAKNAKPLIIDCGSNIGLSVLYFKQIHPTSTIIAFEPDSNNFQLLKKNVNNNHLEQVEIHEEAIWINEGEITFEANESEASHISNGSGEKTVRSVRLKNLLEQKQEIDFLKIDIEGAETQVIPDIKYELARVKNMFLEYHGKVDDTQNLIDLLQIVRSAGFQVYIRNAADSIDHPFIEKRTNTIYDVQLNLFCYKEN